MIEKSKALIAQAVVASPLRIDLAGGWSDTPPVCYKFGGSVLNAAVSLEGDNPVRAEVKRIKGAVVKVESADLGKKGVIKTREEIYGEQDPNDWCALVKSALNVTKYEFDQGALAIKISANVPKGSGMGTSSILGASLVKALLTVRDGFEPEWPVVAERTLALEQTMQTGGGWEDQLGALVPGVKLVTTKPGEKQNFKVKRLSDKAEKNFARFLRERGVLYFTGQKRMARNVLRGVLDFCKRDPEGIASAIIKALKRDAAESFAALERGDFATFTAKLNSYWLNKKALDPGSTNAQVESIIARIAPWTEAVSLCGAGGGGFLFAIARSKPARAKMLRVLETAGNGGKAYEFRVEG